MKSDSCFGKQVQILATYLLALPNPNLIGSNNK